MHEEVVAERDRLAAARRDLDEGVRLLGIANDGLDARVAELVDEREGLLEERSALRKELARLQTVEAELATNLRSREQELAVSRVAVLAESEKVSELQETYEALVGDLEAEVTSGQIRIEQLRDGLEVGVREDVLFASGSARLSGQGAAVLETVVARLAPLAYAISVEGHTDDVAIRGALKQRYPTNWDLAGARAASVVSLFVAAGVDGARLAAVSYGPYRPVADNDTPEARALNRRIEIRLRPLSPVSPLSSLSSEGPADTGSANGGP